MSEIKVVYIVGYGRSGSTILGNVLGEMPDFVHIGELGALWQIGFALEQRLCGCGHVLDTCPIWSEVIAIVRDLRIDDATSQQRALAYQSAVRLRKLPFLLRGRWSNAVSNHARWLDAVYRSVAEVTGARVIVDSSKRPANAAVVAGLPAISTSFVHLVRDPRAVAYSWTRHRTLPRPDDPNRMMIRFSPAESARSWMAANAASDVVVRSVGPHRSARVRYEDFATNPHQVLQRVAELAGCGTVDAPVRGNTIDLKTNHTVGGNPGRMGSGRTEIRLDNEWKTGLTRADVIRVTSWCLPLLAAYGYPIRP